MKKHLHAILWITFVAISVYLPSKAQSVTIDPDSNNPGALINASSDKKGFLLPRMTLNGRISAPLLQVFKSTVPTVLAVQVPTLITALSGFLCLIRQESPML